MRKKVFAALNLLMIAAVLLADRRYILHGTLRFKGEASFCFVLLGAVNLLYVLLSRSKKGYPTAMLAGLALAMAGDVLLGKNFVLGASLFGMGHLFYFAAYCLLSRLRRADGLCIGAIFTGAALLLTVSGLFRFNPPSLLWVCLAYAAMISCMTGKALMNLFRGRTFADAVIALGCVLFFFSDLMLVLEWFAGMDAGFLCLATYYPGQALLAASPFLTAEKEKRNECKTDC